MSGMDGARAAARSNAWRKIHVDCPCGRVIHGNGKAHQRSCRAWLDRYGWPLDVGMQTTIRSELGVEALRRAELGLGRFVLDGGVLPSRWVEFRDLVWRLAEVPS